MVRWVDEWSAPSVVCRRLMTDVESMTGRHAVFRHINAWFVKQAHAEDLADKLHTRTLTDTDAEDALPLPRSNCSDAGMAAAVFTKAAQFVCRWYVFFLCGVEALFWSAVHVWRATLIRLICECVSCMSSHVCVCMCLCVWVWVGCIHAYAACCLFQSPVWYPSFTLRS
jgi:hypothetical protein